MLLEAGKPAEARTAMESAVREQRQAMLLSKNRNSVRTLLGGHLLALVTPSHSGKGNRIWRLQAHQVSQSAETNHRDAFVLDQLARLV